VISKTAPSPLGDHEGQPQRGASPCHRSLRAVAIRQAIIHSVRVQDKDRLLPLGWGSSWRRVSSHRAPSYRACRGAVRCRPVPCAAVWAHCGCQTPSPTRLLTACGAGDAMCGVRHAHGVGARAVQRVWTRCSPSLPFWPCLGVVALLQVSHESMERHRHGLLQQPPTACSSGFRPLPHIKGDVVREDRRCTCLQGVLSLGRSCL